MRKRCPGSFVNTECAEGRPGITHTNVLIHTMANILAYALVLLLPGNECGLLYQYAWYAAPFFAEVTVYAVTVTHRAFVKIVGLEDEWLAVEAL
jgi:hypothetical protein